MYRILIILLVLLHVSPPPCPIPLAPPGPPGLRKAKGQSSFGRDLADAIIAPYTTVQKRILASIYFRAIYASAVSESASEAATDEITSIIRKLILPCLCRYRGLGYYPAQKASRLDPIEALRYE